MKPTPVRQWGWALGALVALVLALAGARLLRAPGPEPPSPEATAGPTAPDDTAGKGAPPPGRPGGASPEEPGEPEPPLLEIGEDEWSWSRAGEEVVTSGSVTNVSDRTLRNLVAEVSYFDGGGRFLASHEAFIFPTGVSAGRTVGFEIRAPWDPAIADARVSFQELYGYAVPTRWKGTRRPPGASR